MFDIKIYPDPILRKQATKILSISRDIKEAIKYMEKKVKENALGIAANQIGIAQQFVVVLDKDTVRRMQQSENNKKPYDQKTIVLINPEIIKSQGTITYEEGCLSCPEICEEVQRKDSIIVKYQDLNLNEKAIEAQGLFSVILQHEIDHLHGKLFIDYLSFIKKDLITRKLLKYGKV